MANFGFFGNCESRIQLNSLVKVVSEKLTTLKRVFWGGESRIQLNGRVKVVPEKRGTLKRSLNACIWQILDFLGIVNRGFS